MSLFKVVSKLKLLENMKDGSGEIHVDVKEIIDKVLMKNKAVYMIKTYLKFGMLGAWVACGLVSHSV